MGLLEVRARRTVATKGARLLRAKREVLAGELWKLMREVLERRSKLDEVLREAVKALGLAARSTAADARVARARRRPGRSAGSRCAASAGVPTATISAPVLVRAADGRGSAPTSWGPAGAEAARRHEEAIEVLLRIASRELQLARLGDGSRRPRAASMRWSSSCSPPSARRRRASKMRSPSATARKRSG
jgi:V/A-type H+-transporting ATPase subunit D